MADNAYTVFFLAVMTVSLLAIAGNVLLAPGLKLVRLVAGAPRPREAGFVRKLSIVVPAYNEEENIAAKITSLQRALQLIDVDAEVIIGSDGSTDRTAEIVRARLACADPVRWRLLEFPNEGKCSTLNKLVGLANGEIIVATDADVPLPDNSLELVVAAFRANRRLGCVSCIPWFEGLDIGRQKAYWGFEDRIRSEESAWGRLIVVTGMLSAFRKEFYEPIPAGVMADDLWVPLNVLLKGGESAQVDALRVPYEKTDEATELLRRKRVMVGGMDVVRRLWPKLTASPSVLVLVLLHKVNRWALPLWALTFLVSVAALLPWVLAAYLVGTLLVMFIPGARKLRMLAYAVLSPVLSFAEVMRGKDFARWEHTRKG